MSLVKWYRSEPQSLFVFVGVRHIVWGASSGKGKSILPLQRRALDLAGDDTQEAAMQALLVVLQQVVVTQSIRDMRVVVTDNWLASANMPWNPGMANAETALHLARTQLAATGHTIGGGDTLRLDNASYGVPRQIFSYPDKLLDGLHQCARRLQVPLRSVLPLSVVAWLATQRQHRRQPAPCRALLIVEESVTMVVQSGSSDPSRMLDVTFRTRHANGRLRDHELQASWRRFCLRQPHLLQVDKVALLDMTLRDDVAPIDKIVSPPFVRIDLGMPAHMPISPVLLNHVRHQSLDAIADTPSMTSWRWGILFGAALLAGVLTMQAIRTRLAVNALTAQLQDLHSANDKQRQSGAGRTVWHREELPRVQAVNVAIRQLNLPIAVILRALVPPADIRVAVLSVETSGNVAIGQNQMLKLIAEAASNTDMTRYVAYLDERRPFIRAYLMKHEINATSAEHPYRFSVEVPWAE